ncbi:MAG: hypothetical protein LUD84_07005 [Clostridiales bacterium]|nr:hypothetical protein [Clostridiales bacterium]
MPCPNCGGCGKPAPLTDLERQILDLLAQNAFLPVARFLLRSPENPEMSFVMSAPVYLAGPETTQEELRAAGTALLRLQRRGFLTLDYGVPLSGFDYTAWERSALYRHFAQSVAAPGAEPHLEPGSAALTLQGQEAIDEE